MPEHTPLPSNIEHTEILARFVMWQSWIRADGTVKPDAFIPPKDLNLSTSRLLGLAPREVWQLGFDVASATARPLIRRADLRVEAVVNAGLDAEAAPLPGNPNHAHIVGWSREKSAQKSAAQQLAAKSKYIINP